MTLKGNQILLVSQKKGRITKFFITFKISRTFGRFLGFSRFVKFGLKYWMNCLFVIFERFFRKIIFMTDFALELYDCLSYKKVKQMLIYPESKLGVSSIQCSWLNFRVLIIKHSTFGYLFHLMIDRDHLINESISVSV